MSRTVSQRAIYASAISNYLKILFFLMKQVLISIKPELMVIQSLMSQLLGMYLPIEA
jgi:hypothetical protein